MYVNNFVSSVTLNSHYMPQPSTMNPFPGDYFNLENLVLPRPASGYGVQHLGTDQILDHQGTHLRPIRQAEITSNFPSFETAQIAGKQYLLRHPEVPLAIVPLAYDPTFQRLVLINGVIPLSVD